MKSSYPSKAAFIFDVPDPEKLDSKFVYRYFMKDERVSEDTIGSESDFKKHGMKYAREVNLSFLPAESSVGFGSGQSKLQFTDAERKKIFEENLDKISSESSIGSRALTSLVIQDRFANSKLQYAIESSLAISGKSSGGLSPIQKILHYGSLTKEVDVQSVLDYTDIDSANEFLTFDPKTGEAISKTGEADVGKLSFAISLNSKFAGEILAKSKNSALSPLSDIEESVILSVQERASSSISDDPSKTIDIDDFEPSTVPVSTKLVDVDTVSSYGNLLLGYLITKSIVEDDGTVSESDKFLITNSRQDNYVDPKIVYGKRYRYEIQSVYLVRMTSYNGEALVASDYLVASRGIATEVFAEEAKPPPSPVDLRFWLSLEKKLHIEWGHPLNKQEDIKRYQVFRRRNVQEPFQLIVELDFDDSTVKTPRSEKIPHQSRKITGPTTVYIDQSYNLDSDYIYAVCSVDARDLSSGYSEQFRVTYEREQGKIRVDRVASAGAPKPYPNFTLDRPLTVDAIKTSGFSRAKLYFDPDYLKVFSLDEKDMELLAIGGSSPTYSIQFINIDLQQDAKVSFSIADKT